jgi:endonuclease YncB( thermonuclease family)
MSKKKLSSKDLIKKGIPYILIPGLLLAITLGFKGATFKGGKDYYQMKQLFPSSGYVQTIEDGDTFTLKSGVKVRLIGIDSPDRGQKGFSEAADELSNQVTIRRVYLEYDRYQDDKFSRVLAWVWIDCEQTPKFLPADYMHKSGNESNVGLTQNPKGCKKGKLLNEELVKKGFATTEVYKDRGELKYESRINGLNH